MNGLFNCGSGKCAITDTVRVLVVEDEPLLLRQLSQALTDAGYAVDTATDGAAADFLGHTEWLRDLESVVTRLALKDFALSDRGPDAARHEAARDNGVANLFADLKEPVIPGCGGRCIGRRVAIGRVTNGRIDRKSTRLNSSHT